MRTAIPYTIDVANGHNAIVVPMLITKADVQVIINCTQSKLILTKLDKDTGIVDEDFVQDQVAGTTTINVTPADQLVDLSCNLAVNDDIDIEIDDKVSAKMLQEHLQYIANGAAIEDNDDSGEIDGEPYTGVTVDFDKTATVDEDVVNL